jgi:hypothetical protein
VGQELAVEEVRLISKSLRVGRALQNCLQRMCMLKKVWS